MKMVIYEVDLLDGQKVQVMTNDRRGFAAASRW
jgi:hypothetical protein